MFLYNLHLASLSQLCISVFSFHFPPFFNKLSYTVSYHNASQHHKGKFVGRYYYILVHQSKIGIIGHSKYKKYRTATTIIAFNKSCNTSITTRNLR